MTALDYLPFEWHGPLGTAIFNFGYSTQPSLHINVETVSISFSKIVGWRQDEGAVEWTQGKQRLIFLWRHFKLWWRTIRSTLKVFTTLKIMPSWSIFWWKKNEVVLYFFLVQRGVSWAERAAADTIQAAQHERVACMYIIMISGKQTNRI